MHVIDHKQFQTKKPKQPKRAKLRKAHWLLALLVIFAGVYAAYLVSTPKQLNNNELAQNQDNSEKSNNQPIEQAAELKTFSAGEFKNLYSSFAYPNTQSLDEKPSITGDEAADKRIQQIAEKRGYRLSSVPVASIVRIGEKYLTDDDLIQPNALVAWQGMKDAAAKAGVDLQMTSAYRSVELQRSIFLQRMKDNGVYTESVAAGYVDHLVEDLLGRVAPPGYSRHHTGYTIDLACEGIGLDAFKRTSCYSWLSKNNYENAKKFGFVPSYPEGAKEQGPEPEPWEYIWVSTYSLYE